MNVKARIASFETCASVNTDSHPLPKDVLRTRPVLPAASTNSSTENEKPLLPPRNFRVSGEDTVKSGENTVKYPDRDNSGKSQKSLPSKSKIALSPMKRRPAPPPPAARYSALFTVNANTERLMDARVVAAIWRQSRCPVADLRWAWDEVGVRGDWSEDEFSKGMGLIDTIRAKMQI